MHAFSGQKLDKIPAHTEQYMTFNTGPHRCVGLNLARLEMKVFYQEWLKRVPPFRLDPEAPPRFMGGFNLAITSLPLIW